VQEGRFGACLMAEPDLVASCVAAMAGTVSVPVTVKCRIGIDEQDAETDFRRFVDTVANAGCRVFVVHARKAWLKGLSPKENREIPPLDYARVYRLKAERPDLTVVLNGGITTLEKCEQHLRHVDGVMLGRAAYHDPYLLAGVDHLLFGADDPPLTRRQALERMIPTIERTLATGGRLNTITRHVLGLYHARPRGRLFRRILSEEGCRPGAGVEVLLKAIAAAEGEAALALSPAAE
jgi:tRNA-dihydrouridine synthase A